jgi:predicted 2-oxoglutarate/Fe(II)-dependent dioxygenase YbiX
VTNESIKIVKNFLSDEECLDAIDYINEVIKNKIENFAIYQDGKRLALQFGKDLYHGHLSNLTLRLVSKKENVFRKYFSMAIKETQEMFSDYDDMYVSSFWIAKQFPGAIVPEHEDTDGGLNTHFEYSAIIYLNTLSDSGELVFPSLDKKYFPQAGDLVIFPSRSTGTHRVEKINEDRYSLPIWITKDIKFIL